MFRLIGVLRSLETMLVTAEVAERAQARAAIADACPFGYEIVAIDCDQHHDGFVVNAIAVSREFREVEGTGASFDEAAESINAQAGHDWYVAGIEVPSFD